MLSYVAQKEGLKLPDPLRQRIAQTSERNLRRALLCFETCKMAQYPFTDNQPVQMTDWEMYIQVCCSLAVPMPVPPHKLQGCFLQVCGIVCFTHLSLTVSRDIVKAACDGSCILMAWFLAVQTDQG